MTEEREFQRICATCAHFDRDASITIQIKPPRGVCTAIDGNFWRNERGIYIEEDLATAGPWLIVHNNFGCVLWKERTDDEAQQ